MCVTTNYITHGACTQGTYPVMLHVHDALGLGFSQKLVKKRGNRGTGILRAFVHSSLHYVCLHGGYALNALI